MRPTRVVFGVAIIAVGVLLLLDRLDFVQLHSVWRAWPLFLVALGISHLIQGWGTHEVGSGAWLVLIGLWLLVGNYGVWGLGFGRSWPLLVIATGASMIVKAVLPRPAENPRQRGDGAGSAGPSGSEASRDSGGARLEVSNGR